MMQMKLTRLTRIRACKWIGSCLLGMAFAWLACAQTVSTTTVQGTVYLADGLPGSGTALVSWPSFTTAANQLVAAGQTTVTIGSDGFMSVNLAPNLGASPAGLFYTAVFHMSDGTTSTQYWVVPAAGQATLASVQSQVMPSVQAVQAVSKSYVDGAIQLAVSSTLTPSGGTLTGPLLLNGDPMQPLQAADKHYVDSSLSQAVPLTGGSLSGPLSAPAVNTVQNCALSANIAACLSSAGTSNAAIVPIGTTGAFKQYQAMQAGASCSLDQSTGMLTILPTNLGAGYTTAPTVTWTLYSANTGTLGTIIASVSGGQVTSYSVSGANSGWHTIAPVSCPINITVGAPPTPTKPVPLANMNKSVQAYQPNVNVDDFGAAGDGSTDDTLAINYASRYAASIGASLSFTSGKKYYVGTVTGYYQGGYDDGSVPIASTFTCTSSGGVPVSPCTLVTGGSGLTTNTVTSTASTGTGINYSPGSISGGSITTLTVSGGTGYPASWSVYVGPTCGGVPCATLAAEPVPEIGYSLSFQQYQTIYGNGATLVGGYAGSYVTASSYTNAWPYVALIGGPPTNEQGVSSNLTIHDLAIDNAFIGIGNAGSTLSLTNVTCTSCGIGVQGSNSQYDTFTNVNFQNSLSGVVLGGTWSLRAPVTGSYVGLGGRDEMDALNLTNEYFSQRSFSTLAQWITTRKSLDCWFDKNFFHIEDQGITNSDNCYTPPGGVVRMPDQDLAGQTVPDEMWRGVTGIATALYTRYGLYTNQVSINGVMDKFGSNYPVVSGFGNTAELISSVGVEDGGCNAGWGGAQSAPFGSASCPNPYEPYSTNLRGMVFANGSSEGYNNITMYGQFQAAIAIPPTFSMPCPTCLPAVTYVNSQNMYVDQLNQTDNVVGEAVPATVMPQRALFRNGVKLPTDSHCFVTTGTRWADGRMNPSTWTMCGRETNVTPNQPPILQFQNIAVNGNIPDTGEVLLPGLKVNGNGVFNGYTNGGPNGGQINTFTITNAGSGYTHYSFVPCTVANSPATIPGSGAYYQANCSAWAGGAGTIISVWCTYCAQGYTSSPAVTINAPSSGTTATATANIYGIDQDNPITHLTTAAFYLNAGGSVAANSTVTLSGITCAGAQYAAWGSEFSDGASILNWGAVGGWGSLQISAVVTNNNVCSITMSNPTSSAITYPAGSASFPWVILLGNIGDSIWGINTVSVTPTVTTATYQPLPLAGTTGSIGGSALTAGTCATGIVTVTGATTGMAAVASPVTYPGAPFEWNAYVSAANTVTVNVCTNLAAGGTPTASAYNVRVLP